MLVDTNVVGELARPRPNSGVLDWADTIRRISLSVVTLEEINFGLSWKPNARIERWLEDFLDRYCRVLPVSAEIAKASGKLRGRLQAGGATRTQTDMLIAATAQHHQLTLVTRNVKDFAGSGVATLNPFS